MEWLYVLNIIVLALLALDNSSLKTKLMGLFEDQKAQIAAIKASVVKVAADIERIAGQVAGGLTKAQAEEIKAELGEVATTLQALDDQNPEPAEPPVEPEPE